MRGGLSILGRSLMKLLVCLKKINEEKNFESPFKDFGRSD